MFFYGVQRKKQCVCNFLIGMTGSDEVKNFAFTPTDTEFARRSPNGGSPGSKYRLRPVSCRQPSPNPKTEQGKKDPDDGNIVLHLQVIDKIFIAHELQQKQQSCHRKRIQIGRAIHVCKETKGISAFA